MVDAFIREHGVTTCPPHRVEHSGPSATGWETPDSFLFRRPASPRSPESKLASAKILTLLEDLSGKGRASPSERFKIQQDAYRWFFQPSDFEEWCDTAGFDPEHVRGKAREVHEKGLPQWRARPGEGSQFHQRRAYRAKLKQMRLS